MAVLHGRASCLNCAAGQTCMRLGKVCSRSHDHLPSPAVQDLKRKVQEGIVEVAAATKLARQKPAEHVRALSLFPSIHYVV